MTRETMLGAEPAPMPWYDPRGWRLGRAWQLWAMAVLSYLLLYATLGREAVLVGITAAWGSV